MNKLKIKNKFKFNNLFLYITLDSLFLRRFFECFKPFFFFIFQNFVLPENFIECKTLFINDLCAKFSIYAQNLVLLDKMFLETSKIYYIDKCCFSKYLPFFLLMQIHIYQIYEIEI